MKFNLSELEHLFSEINEIINFIELSEYQNRRNRVFLGNGDKINFSVPNDTIAHLLGVNTNYLVSTGRFNSTYSFDILKEMCENPYRINQLYKDGIINYDYLFSPYIFKKLEGFRENIRLNSNETELVCKYNVERAYITDEISQKYDYIIVKKYDNGKIGILGIINKETYYVPMTNQLFDSFDEAREKLETYLRNQEVTIMVGVNTFNIVSDYNKSINTSFNEKLEKVKKIKTYKNLFNCILDLSEDYEYSIEKLKQNRTDHYEDNDLIDVIVKAITEGKLIDVNLFRNTNLSKIIEAYNDFLCENKIEKDDSVSQTFTEMKRNLNLVKGKLTEYEEKNQNLREENTDLNNKIGILEEENKEFKETNQKIFELVKPRTI